MSDKFEVVKEYLQELDFHIVDENPDEQLVVVDDEENGLKNLVIDCEDPILIIEQVILGVPSHPGDLFKRLLQMNRNLVHGAFVLDEAAALVLFRDTLQLENLDENELEGSLNSLSLLLSEYSEELIKFSKN